MSYRKENFLTYKRSDLIPKLDYLDEMSDSDIDNLFREVLDNGIYGFCYSMYEEGQGPGATVSEAQIKKRIDILKPHTEAIRSFSTTEGNEYVPKIAKEYGMTTLVGAWLGEDEAKNHEEIDNLIKLANKGLVDIAAVGNEVLYRKDMDEDTLIEYIKKVRKAIPADVPVGYVDAYYEFFRRPKLSDVCDVILCNCYPFWEGTSFENSLQHMRQMYHQAKEAGNGKKVIVTETGWPSEGSSLGEAVPSVENAKKYFINTCLWSQDEEIGVFYFSSFDESWKAETEGDVGAYWGIWDRTGKLKY